MGIPLTAARVEMNRSEPTFRAELTPVANGDRSASIIDDTGNWLYSVLHEPDETASGTIAHDASTTSGTFTTTPDPFTFSHTPTGSPKGVIVFIFTLTNSIGHISEVTYGGLRMFSGGGAGGGGVSLLSFYLFGTLPTGAQTVSIDHDGASETKQAICITITADRELENPDGGIGTATYSKQLKLDRSGLRYGAIISTHDNTTDLVPLSGQTEIDSIDFGAKVARIHRRTNAEGGISDVGYENKVGDGESFTFFFFGVQEIPKVSQLEIYDISDLSNPSLSGTVAALDNLVTNETLHGLAMSSAGDHLYVCGALGTLYTLDISTRSSPSLVDTQKGVGNHWKYGHTLHRVGSELFRASGNPDVFGGGEVGKFDVSTPGSPSLAETLAATISGSTDGRFRVGYITPDSNFIYYPNNAGSSPGSNTITIIAISGTMVETTVSIPDDAGGNVSIEPREVAFLPNPTALANRFVTLHCRVNIYQNGAFTDKYRYFWMTYQTASTNEWDNLSLYSHEVDASGNVDPKKINTARLSKGSAAGRLSITEHPENATLVRADRGESYVYVFIEPNDSVDTGRLQVWEYTNLELALDSSVGRTTPRRLTNMEVQSFHDMGLIQKVSTTLVAIGGNAGLDDRSLVTLDEPAGWTTLTGLLATGGIAAEFGLDGTSPTDRIPTTGQMQFELSNIDQAYSPDDANLAAGFRIGREVRLAVDYDSSTWYPFWGFIDDIAPSEGQHRPRRTTVDCVDIMEIIARQKIRNLETRFDESAAQAVHLLLDQARSDPVGVYYLNDASEFDTYPVLFDLARNEKTAITTELQRVVQTDRDYIYVEGGVLYFEGRGVRADAVDLPVDLTVGDAQLSDLEIDHSGKNLINEVDATVFPASFDSAAVVLFVYDNVPQKINVEEDLGFTARYRDPDQEAERIGGFDMVEPVATTDYTFNEKEDGTGIDLVHQLSVTLTFEGNSADVEITNDGPADGFLTKFQFRGKGIYKYKPVTSNAKNRLRQEQFGILQAKYAMPYHSLPTVGEDAANYILNKFQDPRTFIESIVLWGNRNTTLLDFILKGRMLGSLLDVSETITGITNVTYFIHGVTLDIRELGELFVSFRLAPADTDVVFKFGDALGSGSAFDGDDVFGSSFVL